MSAPVFPPQRTLPRSCSSSVEICPHSFESGLVLREQNCFINQGSQNDYLDSFDGSFCDVTETLDDSSYEGDTEIPDLKLVRKIVSQVEFYLSDENLSHDAFLLKHVQKNKMGYVSIKLLTSFKKVKNLTRDWRKTLYALQFSEILEINEEQTKVRRKIPIPDVLLGLPPTKLLLAWNFDDTEQRPPTCPQTLMETVTSLFAPYGVVTSVRILKPGKEIPCYIKKYISRYPELATKRCALVEYENLEGARTALEALGLKQCSADFSFKVIPVSGRGIRKNSGMESDEIEETELPNKKVLKMQRRPSERSLYAMDDVAFYSSSESDSTPASPVLLPRYLSSSNFASPSTFKPHSFSSPRSSPLLARKNLTQPHHHNPSPLAAELTSGFFSSPGTSPEIYRRIPEFSLDSGFGSTSPWVQRRKAAAHNQRSENKTLPCSPLAVKNSTISIGVPNGILRLPRGPDGSKGFHNNIGRGRLVLRH